MKAFFTIFRKLRASKNSLTIENVVGVAHICPRTDTCWTPNATVAIRTIKNQSSAPVNTMEITRDSTCKCTVGRNENTYSNIGC